MIAHLEYFRDSTTALNPKGVEYIIDHADDEARYDYQSESSLFSVSVKRRDHLPPGPLPRLRFNFCELRRRVLLKQP